MGEKIVIEIILNILIFCYWVEKLNILDVNFGDCFFLDMLLVVNI